MLKIKVNNYFVNYGILFFISFNLLSEDIGQPGELFPVKVDYAESRESSGLVKINNDYFKLIPLSYSKQGEYIEFNKSKIYVQKKDFGESRITITNNKLVDLSDEDRKRTIRESAIIKKALQSYSKDIKPKFNFMRPVEGIISSRYGKKRFINDSPRSPHLALDIAAPEGTAIFTPDNGRIILIGNFFYSGNFVLIDHGYGLVSSYSHLSSVSVSKGDILDKGQKIGEVGSTGRVTGPHLHWTVYYEGVRINPESLLRDNYLKTLL